MGSLIDDLQDPTVFPDKTAHISVVQTHISIVFIGDDFVYKVKKPANFGFLDFSTLEKRKFYCEQEVVLNRRLSRDIYLDVLPITIDKGKHVLNGTEGKTVEYAVKMKRIPDDILMKSIFHKGNLTNAHLEKIAGVLAQFHLNSRRDDEIDEFGHPDRFKINTDENFDQIQKFIGITIQRDVFEGLQKWTQDFFSANRSLFLSRVREGKIRDCHGDLHMEHICFTEELSIIDCIEFNERFRFSDTLADIAFLLMDLEYHGGNRFAEILWDLYKNAANERNADSLLTFYKVYRAVVRGKVNSFQVDDDAIAQVDKDKAIQTAAKYFELAHSYIH